jgi:hypothetical protein
MGHTRTLWQNEIPFATVLQFELPFSSSVIIHPYFLFDSFILNPSESSV